MKREPTNQLCFNHQLRTRELKLVALYLKAETDADVELLEMLDAMLELHAVDPARVSAALAALRAQQPAVDERVAAAIEEVAAKLKMRELARNN